MTEKRMETQAAKIREKVRQVIATTPAYDIHTHLYDPAFGDLLLWGIDDLLVYHYLVAEAFRYLDMPYDKFWAMSKTEQADLIWKELFLEHSPVSEACRGVLTTLHWLGLDVKARDLPSLRGWFSDWKPSDYIGRCMKLGGVRKICMTNSPFDPAERAVWEKGFERDDRFTAALRIDPLILDWTGAGQQLNDWGYCVGAGLNEASVSAARKFLADWSKRIDAQFVMVSLPPEFRYPSDELSAAVIEKVVLPHCKEFDLPLALMPGAKRAVNPKLKLAGDGVGKADMQSFANLFAAHLENKFLLTALSRENQHELCVLARKFRNLHIFGCWWFTNVPHVINEMTRMRLEMLGLSFTPQHSDARVLDQIIYKWRHSRVIIGEALADKYADLLETGWEPAPAEIERDARQLLGGGFEAFSSRR